MVAGPAHYVIMWLLAMLILQLCGYWPHLPCMQLCDYWPCSSCNCLAAGITNHSTVWSLAMLNVQLHGRWPSSSCNCVGAGLTRHAIVWPLARSSCNRVATGHCLGTLNTFSMHLPCYWPRSMTICLAAGQCKRQQYPTSELLPDTCYPHTHCRLTGCLLGATVGLQCPWTQ